MYTWLKFKIIVTEHLECVGYIQGKLETIKYLNNIGLIFYPDFGILNFWYLGLF